MATTTQIASPLVGTVVRVDCSVGAPVEPGTTVVVVESMKMEHAVEAGVAGTVAEVRVAPGDPVQAGDVLVVVDVAEPAGPAGEPTGGGAAGAGGGPAPSAGCGAHPPAGPGRGAAAAGD